jgi:hypothetical protein
MIASLADAGNVKLAAVVLIVSAPLASTGADQQRCRLEAYLLFAADIRPLATVDAHAKHGKGHSTWPAVHASVGPPFVHGIDSYRMALFSGYSHVVSQGIWTDLLHPHATAEIAA